ncbi:uncharacterized protein RCC_06403 [Ramularia collo-cygni]|uniref:Uncharacterized protein n=1 Tax=Ramularia collo-cygni TaxID=112498 RepID=A0A2D3V1D8_9PEZI|nr:uncharacterized protein RCC_06403 [Ramularia collo-cygni]CZT20545.1 uncharacterized protein RCC_06403 [Ramularia collo-cygni]
MPDCKDCKLCRLNQLYILNHDSKKSIFSRYNNKKNISNNDKSTTMAPISDSDRTLRVLNAWLWIPAFALTLAYGITANEVVLPLGIIPMSFSAISTLIHLNPPSANPANRILTVRGGLSAFSDFLIASFLLGLLIPSWILCADGYRSSMMLGAYATVPLMIAFSTHSYFVLRAFGYYMLSPSKKTCPHCNGDLTLKQRAMSEHSGTSHSSKESYHEVQDREAMAGLESEDYREPRASTDDENERLIVN